VTVRVNSSHDDEGVLALPLASHRGCLTIRSVESACRVTSMTHFHRGSPSAECAVGERAARRSRSVRIARDVTYPRASSPARRSPDGERSQRERATRPRPNHAMSTFTAHTAPCPSLCPGVATQNRGERPGMIAERSATTPFPWRARGDGVQWRRQTQERKRRKGELALARGSLTSSRPSVHIAIDPVARSIFLPLSLAARREPLRHDRSVRDECARITRKILAAAVLVAATRCCSTHPFPEMNRLSRRLPACHWPGETRTLARDARCRRRWCDAPGMTPTPTTTSTPTPRVVPVRSRTTGWRGREGRRGGEERREARDRW